MLLTTYSFGGVELQLLLPGVLLSPSAAHCCVLAKVEVVAGASLSILVRE